MDYDKVDEFGRELKSEQMNTLHRQQRLKLAGPMIFLTGFEARCIDLRFRCMSIRGLYYWLYRVV